MQGTWVLSLVQEDFHMSRSSWVPALKLLNVPRACAPQQKNPPPWEAYAPQQSVAPLMATGESPHTPTKIQGNQT